MLHSKNRAYPASHASQRQRKPSATPISRETQPVDYGLLAGRRLLLIGAVITVAVFLSFLVFSVIVAAAVLSPNTDVFAVYDTLAPGQLFSVSDQQRCTRTLMTGGMDYCYIEPGDGVFNLVVITTERGIIRELLFRVKALRVGDLILRWGYSDETQEQRESFILHWGEGVYAVAGESGRRFRYHLPVQLVSIRNMAVPNALPTAGRASALDPLLGCDY